MYRDSWCVPVLQRLMYSLLFVTLLTQCFNVQEEITLPYTEYGNRKINIDRNFACFQYKKNLFTDISNLAIFTRDSLMHAIMQY